MSQHSPASNLFQPALYRILDANLDRVREGLRIIEEWCRFGLKDADLTAKLKDLRQVTAHWHQPVFRTARDTVADPGTDLSHTQEMARLDIQHVLQANICRVEEALRVIEEYGKLYSVEMAETFKQMRYQVYVLESTLLANDRQQTLLQAKLYLVTSPHDSLLGVVEAALQGGLRLVQLRDKQADDTTRLELATQLCELCHRYGALFLVNDRVDLALAANADGVHLGQQDIPVSLARQILGPNRIIGRSTTNPDELHKALQDGVDYVGVGPVYETPTKPGKAAAGLEYVRYAAEHVQIPWFAIGSVDPNNVKEVIGAGGQRVAVVRAIMQAEQPTLATQYFLAQLQCPSVQNT
ncbi:MAG: thiamine phosphate synthase [Cyanobacteria bacterium P01_H01_bin.121]